MRVPSPLTKHPAGFIRGRGFLTLLGLSAIGALIYFGSNWGREYYIIKMGQETSNRMWTIEDAKKKYKAKSGRKHGDIPHYSELLAYLPGTGFPMCPWGGDFENRLSLDKPVTCPQNGKPEYEPKNASGNPLRNGYNDLAKREKTMTFFDYLQTRVKPGGNQTPEDKKKKLFE